MNPEAYLDHIRSDADLLATVVERGPLDAPVRACPGWDVGQLARHVGSVHRWARAAVLEARRPELDPDSPTDAELGAWLRAGAAALTEAIASVAPDAPTWHPFPVALQARVWPRRQAIETLIHRWDAEDAVDGVSAIDPELASDGVDEYFELGLPRLVVREGIALPAGSLHVHCTDVEGEWLVRAVDTDGATRVELERRHAKGDAALRGTAATLLLAMWDRAPVDGVEIIGDEAVARAWLELPGL